MPSTPTTKSQVQAYRFVLRRMQSALVRRDSVMLHDPMRSHGRATLVGFLLGILGVVGFVIFGLISPSPSVPNSGIVIGKDSGTIYVVSNNPKTLTPTFNLASAKLLLMAQQQGGGGASSGAPEVVPDSALENIPHNRRTGIVDGPQLLPSSSQRISDNWGVCDNLVINQNLPDDLKLPQSKLETTVFAGVPNLGAELSTDSAIYTKADNGKYYLIYRLPNNPNDPSANTVRAEVSPNDTAVTAVFKLDNSLVRPISIGLLNSIPPVTPLTAPRVPGNGTSTSFQRLASEGLHTGSVFKVNSAGGGSEVFVILQNGIQQVPAAVGDLIRTAQQGSGKTIPSVSPDEINGVPQIAASDQNALQVNTMPSVVPTVLDPAKSPTTCLGWDIVNNQPHTVVSVSAALPTPKDAKLIDIGKPGPRGKIDHFYMPPGFGAVVQSATGPESFGKGPLGLVTDNGLQYGIPNVQTLQGLGLDNPRPAPDSILGLLPTGTTLNTQDAQRSFDDIPLAAGAGTFPPQSSQSQSPGTSGGN